MCKKCDGRHKSSSCPYFKEERTVTQDDLDAAALKLGITLPLQVEPLYLNKTILAKRSDFRRDDKHATMPFGSSSSSSSSTDDGLIVQCNVLNQFHPRYLGRSLSAIDFTSLHFTSLHFTSLHFTSLHFTSLHFTSLQFNSLHSTSLHFTPLHFTSLHFTSLHFTSLHFTSLHFTSLYIT